MKQRNKYKSAKEANSFAFSFLIGLGILILGGNAGVFSEDLKILSLSDVVEAVLKTSPDLQNADAKVAEARGSENEAKAGDLPNLSAMSLMTRGNDPVYAFGSLLNQRSFTAQDFNLGALNYPGYVDNIDTALQLSVPVFSGFQTQSMKQAGKLGFKLSQKEKEALAQNLRFEAVEAYLQILLERQMLDELSHRVQSSEKKISDSKSLKDKGLILGSDFYAAQAIEGGLKARLIQSRRMLEEARWQLMTLMGASDERWDLKGQLYPTVYIIKDKDQLFEEALIHRPELQGARLGRSIAEVLHQKEKLSLLPQVQAFATLDSNTNGASPLATDKMMGLAAQIPIADPSYFARKSIAQAKVQEASAEERSLQQKIHSEIIETVEGYKGFAEALPILTETLKQAQKALKLVGPLYREGRQSIVEALRAEEGEMQAQKALLEDSFGIHSGYARILLSAGDLDATGIVKIERHLETGKK